MRPTWYELRAANDPVLEIREQLEKQFKNHSFTTSPTDHYYLEFSTRHHYGWQYEYTLNDRRTGKRLNAGRAFLRSESLAILLHDVTTYEAIQYMDNTDCYPANTFWLLAKNGLEIGKLTYKNIERDLRGKGFFKRLAHKLLGGSVNWHVTLSSGQQGEMRIDYPLGSNRTSRRLLLFENVVLPVHLSRSSEHDPASENQDFRYPQLWDDDYVLPVGTPKCGQDFLEIGFLLNLFFRLYYTLDFSDS